MPATPAGRLLHDPLVIIIGAVAILGFLTAYYFIRKSLQPTEDFDNSILRSLSHEDKQESLQYCISFFQDAYDANELPDLSIFMELRLKASIVFTFYKNVRRAAYVYSKLRSCYYKDRPLPDFTDRYKEKLRENGREGDILSAFCLCGIEEFEKLEEQTNP
jgi:hypothetical protein